MILAVDVDYQDDHATIAGLTFEHWPDANACGIYQSTLDQIAPYQPGEFYRRELPCILKLLKEHDLNPDTIVIDGLVYLDGRSQHGLGWYLYQALEAKVQIIGVAKKPFAGIAKECELYRGDSKNPLYVTAIGLSLDEAKTYIRTMHGQFRVPDLLKKVDRLCRTMETTS